MPSPQRIIVVAGLAASSALVGCTGKPPPACYDLSLSDFKGAEGYAYVYDISPTMLWVTLDDDFGNPPRRLWETKLTAAQQASFARFAAELPLDRLRDKYEDTSVADGYQYTYRLRIGDNAPRQIEVNNVAQPQLEPLIDLVNNVVPGKFRAAAPRSMVVFPSSRPSKSLFGDD